MFRDRRLLAVPLALAFVLPGCGGSEEDAVRDSLKTFAQAAVDGDGDKACNQLTKSARDAIKVGDRDCGDIFGQIAGDQKAEAEKQLDEIDDLDVKVDGDKATVSGEGEDVSMVKEGGDWKLAAE